MPGPVSQAPPNPTLRTVMRSLNLIAPILPHFNIGEHRSA